jgi:hypothetical protein
MIDKNHHNIINMSKFEINLLKYKITARLYDIFHIYIRNPRLIHYRLIYDLPCLYSCAIQSIGNIEQNFNLETLGWHVFSTEGECPNYQYNAKYPNFMFQEKLYIIYKDYVFIYQVSKRLLSGYLTNKIYNKYNNYYYISNVLNPLHKLPSDCETLVIYDRIFNTSLISILAFMKMCLEKDILNDRLKTIYLHEEPMISCYDIEDFNLIHNDGLKNLLEDVRLCEVVKQFHDKYPDIKLRFNRRLSDKNIILHNNLYCEVNINQILRVLKYEYTL